MGSYLTSASLQGRRDLLARANSHADRHYLHSAAVHIARREPRTQHISADRPNIRVCDSWPRDTCILQLSASAGVPAAPAIGEWNLHAAKSQSAEGRKQRQSKCHRTAGRHEEIFFPLARLRIADLNTNFNCFTEVEARSQLKREECANKEINRESEIALGAIRQGRDICAESTKERLAIHTRKHKEINCVEKSKSCHNPADVIDEQPLLYLFEMFIFDEINEIVALSIFSMLC